jgi:serine/threonine protein kinase
MVPSDGRPVGAFESWASPVLAAPGSGLDGWRGGGVMSTVPSDCTSGKPRAPPSGVIGTVFSGGGSAGTCIMGEVFSAYDPHLDRRIALKLLRPGALATQEGHARLIREAQSLARLQHPNVIAVHDVGSFEDRVFIAMEFVEGETLTNWLRGPRTWHEIVDVMIQAGRGLAAAHRAGLVHRDFKPDNVLLDSDNRARVVDFGLARQTSATQPADAPEPEHESSHVEEPENQLTRDGAVMGTPGYMPPEQMRGEPTDARTDQFSFCVTLYQALYRRLPFEGGTLRHYAAAMEEGTILPPPASTDVPEWIFAALERGLSTKSGARFATMEALLAALRPRTRRKRRTVVAGLALVLVASAGGGYGLWARNRLQLCAGSENRLAGIWDAPTRTRLAATFRATGIPYAADAFASVQKSLDAWALEWVAASREACEATRLRQFDSEELYQLKSACLEDRLAQVSALTSLFEAPDREIVTQSAGAARSLDSISSCLGRDAASRITPQTDDEQRAESTFRLRYAEAQALFAAGKYTSVDERLRDVLASKISHRSTAEGLLLLGRSVLRAGNPNRAREAYVRAAQSALRAGDALLEARALSRLFASEGFDERSADADAWGVLARSAAERAPGHWDVEAEIAQNEALVALGRNQPRAAFEGFEHVLKLQREHLGPEHPEVASTLNNLGVTLTRLGRYDQAIGRYEESLRLHTAIEGPEHPNVAQSAHNLGAVLRTLGRPFEAKSYLERAVAIRSSALGASHPDTVTSTMSHVRVLIALGELEPAQEHLSRLKTLDAGAGATPARAMALLGLESELYFAGGFFKEALKSAAELLIAAEASGAPDGRVIMESHLHAGRALTGLGSWTEARRHLLEARRMALAHERSSGPDVAEAEEALGALALALRRPTEALPHYTAALELRKKTPSASARSLAQTFAQVGRLHVETGQPESAIEPLTHAEEFYAAARHPGPLASARMWHGQALWLARPEERGQAVDLFLQAMPDLPEIERQSLTQWLSHNKAQLPTDAGR